MVVWRSAVCAVQSISTFAIGLYIVSMIPVILIIYSFVENYRYIKRSDWKMCERGIWAEKLHKGFVCWFCCITAWKVILKMTNRFKSFSTSISKCLNSSIVQRHMSAGDAVSLKGNLRKCLFSIYRTMDIFSLWWRNSLLLPVERMCKRD